MNTATAIHSIGIFVGGASSFVIGFIIAPWFIKLVYKYKLWRKTNRNINITNQDFAKIHNDEENHTPRVGGALVIFTTILTVLFLLILSRLAGYGASSGFDFLSRRQTLLPLGAFIFAGIIGFFDDSIQIWGKGFWATDPIVLRFIKSASIIGLGLLLSLWFYFKLGVNTVHLPFYGDMHLGLVFIPFFIFILYAVFSGSVIDGIDGLSGGVLASAFGAYAVITFFHHQYDLSALAVIVFSAIMVFLWYNIMPAKFYMGETGMLALTVLITIYAFFTNTVLLLPIIIFPLFISSGSVVLQLISKKIRKGKRLFKVSPLHHHLEAVGWGKSQIVMRFWLVGIMSAVIGSILAFVS